EIFAVIKPHGLLLLVSEERPIVVEQKGIAQGLLHPAPLQITALNPGVMSRTNPLHIASFFSIQSAGAVVNGSMSSGPARLRRGRLLREGPGRSRPDQRGADRPPARRHRSISPERPMQRRQPTPPRLWPSRPAW